ALAAEQRGPGDGADDAVDPQRLAVDVGEARLEELHRREGLRTVHAVLVDGTAADAVQAALDGENGGQVGVAGFDDVAGERGRGQAAGERGGARWSSGGGATGRRAAERAGAGLRFR